MNFLAHLSLSDEDDDLMLGNFIADAVRSSEWPNYQSRVVEGIRLHHKIDFYTDSHPVVSESKKRLRPNHGKYSPVVVDIIYDHFLARSFEEYHHQDLRDFAGAAYRLFRSRWDELPGAIQYMLPHMERGNWLVNYGHREGLQRVFNGMSRRASFKNQMQDATADLYREYDIFEKHFQEFYPDLRAYVKARIKEIND